jgi:hypothetical protein
MSMSATRVALPDRVVCTIPLPAFPIIPLGAYNSTISLLSRFPMPVQLILDVITVCAALV